MIARLAVLSHKGFLANRMSGGHRKQSQSDHWFDAFIDA
jgi:hypothetical protein